MQEISEFLLGKLGPFERLIVKSTDLYNVHREGERGRQSFGRVEVVSIHLFIYLRALGPALVPSRPGIQ